MSVTIGKNLDTGMTTLKFDSTGRTVELMPSESEDFEKKLKLLKIEWKIQKESIHNIIAADRNSSNPLCLFIDTNSIDINNIEPEIFNIAIEVSKSIKNIFDEMVSEILKIFAAQEYNQFLNYKVSTSIMISISDDAIKKIRALYVSNSGINDILSKDVMRRYVYTELNKSNLLQSIDSYQLSNSIFEKM
jgi:hypothetical protein